MTGWLFFAFIRFQQSIAVNMAMAIRPSPVAANGVYTVTSR